MTSTLSCSRISKSKNPALRNRKTSHVGHNCTTFALLLAILLNWPPIMKERILWTMAWCSRSSMWYTLCNVNISLSPLCHFWSLSEGITHSAHWEKSDHTLQLKSSVIMSRSSPLSWKSWSLFSTVSLLVGVNTSVIKYKIKTYNRVSEINNPWFLKVMLRFTGGFSEC